MSGTAKQKTSRMPKFYLPPSGGPLYWRNEPSGELSAAIGAYLFRKQGETMTPVQIELMREYLVYYINAPCWNFPGNSLADELEALKASAEQIKTVGDIEKWIYKALAIGFDPL